MNYSGIDYANAISAVDAKEELVAHVKSILNKHGFGVSFNANGTVMYLTKEDTVICEVADFDRLAAIALGMELTANYEKFMESTL